MKVAVWDTYVSRKDGLTMHFDILVPSALTDEAKIFNFGKAYLAEKSFETGVLTAKECQLCHIEEATQDIIDDIQHKGYYIVEMENCNQ